MRQRSGLSSPDGVKKHPYLSQCYDRRAEHATASMRRFAPDECVLKKGRESRRSRGTLLMYYNFGRVHQTLRVTPAMEAGVANGMWSVQEIVALLD
jgi:hypothetical protein